MPIDVNVAPSRDSVIAELRNRGHQFDAGGNPATAQLNQTLEAGGVPSLRDAQRQLKLKETAGAIDRSALMNELLSRRAKGELFQMPTHAENEAAAMQRGNAAAAAQGVASEDPNTRAKSLNDSRNRQVESAYAQTVGTLPETFEIPSNTTPKPFDMFFHDQFGPQINGQQDPQFPLGSKEDNQLRAQNYNRLFSDPNVKKLYDKYSKDTANRTTSVQRGTPEYYAKLEGAVKEKVAQDAYNAALNKAVPGVLEQQAKAEAELPGKIGESSKKLRDEIQNNKILENAKLQLGAVEQIRGLTSKPNPSNQDDLALIYSTVRALDPVSAVREGEITLLKKGAGLPTQITTAFNSIFGNENAVLTPEIRKNLARMAETQAATARKAALPELKRYHQSATEQGLPVSQIFSSSEQDLIHGDHGPESKSAPAAPAHAVSPEDLNSAVTVQNPKDAPADKKYIKSPDGRTFLNPNFKG